MTAHCLLNGLNFLFYEFVTCWVCSFVVLVLSLLFSYCTGNYSGHELSKVYINNHISCIIPTLNHTIWVEFRTHSGLGQISFLLGIPTQHTCMPDFILILLNTYEFTMHENLESQYTVVNKTCPNVLIMSLYLSPLLFWQSFVMITFSLFICNYLCKCFNDSNGSRGLCSWITSFKLKKNL